MKLAIMQPYFLPYIGYFQLINAVDKFVVYDNIQFTKKGWINRNRILVNGKDEYISLPVKKDSDYLDVKERSLAETWPAESTKMLNKIRESYRRSPQFGEVFPLVEKILGCEDQNLFNFLLNSLNLVKSYLEISTPFVVSSTVDIDHNLKAQAKVIALCEAMDTEVYINASGGVDLYDKEVFKTHNIELQFLKTSGIAYKQHTHEFVPALSILDVMMFNSKADIRNYLDNSFHLI